MDRELAHILTQLLTASAARIRKISKKVKHKYYSK